METLTTTSTTPSNTTTLYPFLTKFSRLFPSSCTHFKNDVVLIPPSHKLHENDHSSTKLFNKYSKTQSRVSNVHHTSSSYTTCFTDDLGSDTFFSLSSAVPDNSFRLQNKLSSAAGSRRIISDDVKFNHVYQMGSSRSFSSVNSSAGKPPGNKKYYHPIISFGNVSTQLYYGDSSKLRRRRRRRRSRRKRSVVWCKSMVEEGYAVEKKSVDPREDFRESMVEMIVEKGMFGKEDLERLLICFLTLNTASYHAIIVQVFTEICETLFSN